MRSRTPAFAAVIGDLVGGAATFDETTPPFPASRWTSPRPDLVQDGPRRPTLLAGCAIPGVYPWVDLSPMRLYVIGVVANVPMRQALEMGARSLVVLDCAFPGHLPDAPESLAEASLSP